MSTFKKIESEKYLIESSLFFAVYDSYPVSKGHVLIISKSEKEDYFELNLDERLELQEFILEVKELLEKLYSPDGYNIGMNCGKIAGQTIMHFHCHVIPRFKGDMKNPDGGIRHCIEGKGYYETIK
jgi:diadenosine tetraphosphate (Ap4A) HIT family hydrolase